MMRLILAAAAALALVSASPARACPDCKSCQHVAQADTKPADKKDPKAATPCGCAGANAKECKCGKDCKCPHCHHGTADEKAEKKS
jgi:hypothetical protein